MKWKSLSFVQLFVTLWTVAHQPPLYMGFPRQEYWSGLPFPSIGDLPDLGIEPGSPELQADSLLPEPRGKSPKSRVFHNTALGGTSKFVLLVPLKVSLVPKECF